MENLRQRRKSAAEAGGEPQKPDHPGSVPALLPSALIRSHALFTALLLHLRALRSFVVLLGFQGIANRMQLHQYSLRILINAT